MLRKSVTILLAFCLTLSLAIPGFAADDTVTGSLGGDVTYTAIVVGGTGMGQSKKYEVTVSGTGPMNDYSVDNYSPITNLLYTYSISSLTIEEGVTNIGSYFIYLSSHPEITVAGSVKEIKSNAFTNVSNGGITFTGSAPTFSDTAFSGSSLTIYYPEDDDSWNSVVGNQYGASKIEWVPYGEFPKGDCGDDVHWYLIDGVLTIYGDGETWTNYSSASHPGFYDYRDEIEGVVIESGVTTISGSLLRGLSMTKITIADTVKSIGLAAFYNCTKLASITLPESLTEIGQNAFNGCAALTSITIPENVTSIGNNAFQNTSINVIIFTGDPPQFGTSTLTLNGVSGIGYYPADNENWTEQVLSSTYGGTFEWKTYGEADKTELEEAIAEAEKKSEDDYTPNSWADFKNALDAARETDALDDVNQYQVNNVTKTLTNAMTALKEKAEKNELETAISDAENLKEEDYTPKSWADFTAALDTAKEVEADENATQDEVDDAAAVLISAMSSLTKKTDRSELESAISIAEDLREEDYTEDSWADFVSALDTAREVEADENATQDEADDAAVALILAMAALTEKTDRTELESAISTAENLKEEDYTAESWADLTVALSTAKEVENNESASQEEINAATDVLLSALGDLTEAESAGTGSSGTGSSGTGSSGTGSSGTGSSGTGSSGTGSSETGSSETGSSETGSSGTGSSGTGSSGTGSSGTGSSGTGSNGTGSTSSSSGTSTGKTSPQTSDDSVHDTGMWWIIVCVFGLAGSIVFALYKISGTKKSKENE